MTHRQALDGFTKLINEMPECEITFLAMGAEEHCSTWRCTTLSGDRPDSFLPSWKWEYTKEALFVEDISRIMIVFCTPEALRGFPQFGPFSYGYLYYLIYDGDTVRRA